MEQIKSLFPTEEAFNAFIEQKRQQKSVELGVTPEQWDAMAAASVPPVLATEESTSTTTAKSSKSNA